MWEHEWDVKAGFSALSYPKGGVAPLRHDLALFDYTQNCRARFTSLRGVWRRAESVAASTRETGHGRTAFRFTAILWNRP